MIFISHPAIANLKEKINFTINFDIKIKDTFEFSDEK